MKNYAIIDAHCHVQFSTYDNDREEVIRRAQEAGVKMIVGGTQLATSKSGIELAHKYPEDIWATVGFHPHHAAGGEEEFDIQKLRELAKDPKVVAIGECGLDYYRPTTNDKRQTTLRDLQKETFLQMVELAKELNKPLVIHCRPSEGSDDAYEDAYNLLTTNNLRLTTIFHFFAGSLAAAKKFVEAGFYFTFGGVITFTRDYDEIIKYIPLDRIMLETDAPYVAPEPYRGKRNEPVYVVEVAKKMAEIKNVGLDDLVEATYSNTKRIFKI